MSLEINKQLWNGICKAIALKKWMWIENILKKLFVIFEMRAFIKGKMIGDFYYKVIALAK